MLIVSLVACLSLDGSNVDSFPVSDPVEDCGNGSDDDQDGAVDCADSDCMQSPDCPEHCGNGVDDDGDGLIDCADWDCRPDELCPEDCANRRDDDNDGLVDCADPDCIPHEACPEECDNQSDDDDDGLIDCLDPDCLDVPECGEICDDGIDNNSDGRSDCEDPRCNHVWECGETQSGSCADGLDNDADGLTDCEDGGCLRFCQELACDNGLDDDEDGLSDCDDVDCWGLTECPDSVGLFWTGHGMTRESSSGSGGWSGSTSSQSGFGSFYIVEWRDFSPVGTAFFSLGEEVGSCRWSATRMNGRYFFSNSDWSFRGAQSFQLRSFTSTGACNGLVTESMFEFDSGRYSPVRISSSFRGLRLDGDPFGAVDWNDRRPWVVELE